MSVVHLPVHPGRHGRRDTGSTKLPADLHRKRTDPEKHRTGRVAASAGVVALIIVAAVAVVVVLRPSGSTRALSSVPASSGAGAVVQAASVRQVLVRRSGGSILVVSRPRVVTADGYLLSPTSVRQGDAVRVQNEQIVDASQTRASLRGLVAAPPDLRTGTMTVQLPSGLQILADLGPGTRINGAGFSATSSGLVTEADQVELVGTFDKHLGEMTQTATVSLSSPKT
jgi:hypothetical protein